MAPKHKLRIYTGPIWVTPEGARRLWYTECLGCDWDVDTVYRYPDGEALWGRPNLDAALAVGIAHQKEEQDAARLAR